MSHTPGPWQMTGSHDGRTDAIRGRGPHLAGCIAMMTGPWCHASQRAEQEANARLIASAPDLLEALKELLASQLAIMPSFEAGKTAQDDWADRRAKARNDATAAIAKAEGRS